MSQTWPNIWEGVFTTPIPERFNKPRTYGLTMVMDKGLGLNETSELLSMADRYIDYIKLAFGTPALYSPELLRKKISLIRSFDVHVYPGGTFFEIAILQNNMEAFLDKVWDLGFTAIEVSDGTVPMPPATRRKAIQKAAAKGFQVLSEVGKKDPGQNLSVETTAQQVKDDLETGAFKVILEARESGKGIGIFNSHGEIIKDDFAELVSRVPSLESIIWEAPLKPQQQELILAFGPNVNLGNIPPGEMLALESLRVGLRGDTLKTVIKREPAGI